MIRPLVTAWGSMDHTEHNGRQSAQGRVNSKFNLSIIVFLVKIC